MRPPSLQILSVEEAFGRNGWHCEHVEGQEVIQAAFTGHHTRIDLFAQAYIPLNALSVTGEMPLPVEPTHLPAILELLARANKYLNLGGFEFDIDRNRLLFRITNLFDREKYDADIVDTMVHCTIAELDRMAPYATTVLHTKADLLRDLDISRLLMREDLIPPVPGDVDNTP